jgi:hypothetical protein
MTILTERITTELIVLIILISFIAPSVYADIITHNYGALYPDGVDSRQQAINAAIDQEDMGYYVYAISNSDASSAYSDMTDDAIFNYIGHGYPGRIQFYNQGTYSYITASKIGDPLPNNYYLSDFSNQLDDVLFALFVACKSASSNQTYGDLLSVAHQKGVDTSLGFTENVSVIPANLWSDLFWSNCEHYNWSVQISAQSAAYGVLIQKGEYGGTNQRVINGSGGLIFKPARYGV